MVEGELEVGEFLDVDWRGVGIFVAVVGKKLVDCFELFVERGVG